jgi:2-polyprenyl-3-methyl-5-hydroxy-6-metoxy-1,4-benzoquinol methylase
MTDSDTIGTYQSVAQEYRERHGDRSVIEELVEQFLDRLEAVTTENTETDSESIRADDERVSTDARHARIADVGCGPGWESATFTERGHEVVGVDLTPAFLRAARDEAPDAGLDVESVSDGDWVQLLARA